MKALLAAFVVIGRTRVVDGPEGLSIYGWGPAEVRSFPGTGNYGTVVIE